MKLVVCNGKELAVYDLGELRMRMLQRAGGPPIKAHGKFLMEDDEARALVRGLTDTGCYDRG